MQIVGFSDAVAQIMEVTNLALIGTTLMILQFSLQISNKMCVESGRSFNQKQHFTSNERRELKERLNKSHFSHCNHV